MTKEKINVEDLYRIIEDCVRNKCNAIAKKCLDEFFESNICIPKGENVIIQKQLNVDEWCDSGMFAKDSTYRIKPSEPIHEYMIYDKDGNITWATEEKFTTQTTYPYIAMSTKRIRK